MKLGIKPLPPQILHRSDIGIADCELDLKVFAMYFLIIFYLGTVAALICNLHRLLIVFSDDKLQL
jgi:hypothetical protein